MNLGWNQITEANRSKILSEIINHIEQGNHVCRVGWACERVMRQKVQPNVLDKFAAKVTESGQYTKESANIMFKYDWNIRKTSLLELESKLLDIKTKKRQLKWFYPLLIFSILSVIITGVSVFINYKNLDLQKEKVKFLEEELKSLKFNKGSEETTKDGSYHK